MNPVQRITDRWSADGGYREFLSLALPLILTTASISIQHFIDRVFLTWYSTQGLAAGAPAGMTHFVFLSFFFGIASYTNTFVAQYTGARHHEHVGPAVWQGVWVAVACGLLALIPAALSDRLFELIGHDEPVQRLESIYFRTLCYGSGFHTLQVALSCFYTGRGQTWTVLIVNVVATVINIFLDYVLIFGVWGFPEWGIRGAAWATNIAGLVGSVFFFVLIMLPSNRGRFATLRGWRLEFPLMRRLLRFGGPNGLTFTLEVLAFSLFILIAGRLGTVELAASNLTSHINGLAFMPLLGASIALSTMVGQRLGRDQPSQAEYATWSGAHVGLAYTLAMAAFYVFVPELFLRPFSQGNSDVEFRAAYALAIPLLRIVAVYCVFDAFYMTFTAALKGAGDTRYIMWVCALMAWLLMVIPAFIGQAYFGAGLFQLWCFVCLYIISLSVIFYFRFRQGKWKQMRVIEPTVLEGAAAEGNRIAGEADAGADGGALEIAILDASSEGWEKQVDRLQRQLGSPGNETLFPPHYLKSTFPRISGRIARFERQGRLLAAGFLFPRSLGEGWREYTLRLHRTDSAVDANRLVQEVTAKLGSDRLFLYDAEGEHEFAHDEHPGPQLAVHRPGKEDAVAIRRMQQTIWGSGTGSLYPSDIHSMGFRAGSSLVAKVGPEPAGFLFGFFAFGGHILPPVWERDGALRVESQLMGVLPQYRGRNVALSMKRKQIEQVESEGVSVVTWTVDPLQFANARLNFGQLGAVAYEFHADYYSFRNELNRTPASRLVITWLVDSRRVRSADAQNPIRNLQGDAGPQRLSLLHPASDQLTLPSGEASEVAIEIPASWTTLQQENPELAAAWRSGTDRIFSEILGCQSGQYMITGVAEDGAKKYLIAQSVDAQLLEKLGRKNAHSSTA